MDEVTPRLSIFYQLFVASRLGGQLTDDALGPTGVEGGEYAILSVLQARGPASVGEVARSTGSPIATTSRHLKELERDDVVKKAPDRADRRRVIYQLAARGLERFRAAQVPFTEMHLRVEEVLGGDKEAVAWALGRLDNAMRTVSGEGTVSNPRDDFRAVVASLDYRGPVLDSTLENHILEYIDWIRSRTDQIGA